MVTQTFAPPAEDDVWRPERLRCADCATEWFSRMAVLLATTELGRCAACGGRLELAAEPVRQAA